MYTGVSTRCSNSAVMSLRAQEFRSLMACGMKLSLSLVVRYRLPDGSRRNSLCFGCLMILLAFFQHCLEQSSSKGGSFVLFRCWAALVVEGGATATAGFDAAHQDALHCAPVEADEYPWVNVESPQPAEEEETMSWCFSWWCQCGESRSDPH